MNKLSIKIDRNNCRVNRTGEHSFYPRHRFSLPFVRHELLQKQTRVLPPFSKHEVLDVLNLQKGEDRKDVLAVQFMEDIVLACAVDLDP